MDKYYIKKIVEQNPILQDKLFCRGFILTDMSIDPANYPFYGKWKKGNIKRYNLLVSPKQNYYTLNKAGIDYVLIGHAYNPIDGETDENAILKALSSDLDFESCNTKYLNQITGVFTLICIGGVKKLNSMVMQHVCSQHFLD